MTEVVAPLHAARGWLTHPPETVTAPLGLTAY